MSGPLLSKPFAEYSPEEFKAHVRGLFEKRVKKAGRKKIRELKVTVRRLKKGGLSVKTKRVPKYVTEEEYEGLLCEYERGELDAALKGEGIHVLADHKEAERIKRGE